MIHAPVHGKMFRSVVNVRCRNAELSQLFSRAGRDCESDAKLMYVCCRSNVSTHRFNKKGLKVTHRRQSR